MTTAEGNQNEQDGDDDGNTPPDDFLVTWWRFRIVHHGGNMWNWVPLFFETLEAASVSHCGQEFPTL